MRYMGQVGEAMVLLAGRRTVEHQGTRIPSVIPTEYLKEVRISSCTVEKATA